MTQSENVTRVRAAKLWHRMLGLALLFVVATGQASTSGCTASEEPALASNDAATADPAALEAEFAQYDITEDGWLDGTELDACNCRGYDMDGDGEITRAEFQAGRIMEQSAPQPAPTPQPAPVAGRTEDSERDFALWDVDRDGFLSGAELDRCGCRRYDTDGDGQIHLVDLYTGRLLEEDVKPAPAPRPQPSPAPSRPAPGPAGGPALTTYDCYQSSPYMYAFKTFTLRAGNRYDAYISTDLNDPNTRLGSGRYSYDPATRLITFLDGPWHAAELAGIYPMEEGTPGRIVLKPRDDPHMQSRGFASCYLPAK